MGISLGLPRRAPAEKRQIHVVSHTHWDREWYLPFEEFRVGLVATVDGLLDLLARDARFRHFTLDGQTVILEDYLDARPERREEVRRHVAEGRLLIGPWYVMPDEFLVSAEALVRNLLRGLRVAAGFGPPMLVGYLPDTFGHVSQLPQILRGFGIDSALLWRGIDGRGRHNEFIWRAQDGSSILVHYLRQGYSNAEHLPTDPRQFLDRVNGLRRQLEPHATTNCVLVMNGGDHAAPQAELPVVLAAVDGQLRDAELVHSSLPAYVEAVRSSAARRAVRWDVVEGEFRSPMRAPILAGVLSTRMWIKQRNAALETLLEKWAEPFAVFSGLSPRLGPLLKLAWRRLLLNQPHDSICGCSVDQVHDEMRVRFDRADQLAGRIVDQALEKIAAEIDVSSVRPPVGHEAGRVHLTYLVVFNPANARRSDFVSATVASPEGARTFALADGEGRPVPYQILSRQAGEVMAVTASREQVLSYLGLAGNCEGWRLALLEKAVAALTRGGLPRLALTGFAFRPARRSGLIEVDLHSVESGEQDREAIVRFVRELRAALSRGGVEAIRLRLLRQERIGIGFVARDLPAHGYALYQLLPGQHRAEPPSPAVGFLENEFISAKVDPDDGTLVVLDKDAGVVYRGLNAFVDSGDAGDEYTACPPPRDLVVDRPAQPPVIALVEDGPARQVLRVDHAYVLPESLDADRQSRSDDSVPCAISTRISLSPGVRRIDFETVVDNAAKDHLLRVRFPTGVVAKQSYTAGHFGVESRSIASPPDGRGWPERPTATFPHSGWVDVSDGRRGLLVAALGLPEAAVLPDESGAVVYLTLLRCVGWLSRDDLATRQGAAGPVVPTPSAQCLGRHVFHYSLVPHRGGWEEAATEARAFATPLRAVAVSARGSSLPPDLSFLSVTPTSLVVSAVKPPEEGDGFVVRVFNPTSADAQARLQFWQPLARARLVNLDEQSLADLPVDGSVVRFPVRAGQIVTLRLWSALDAVRADATGREGHADEDA